MKKVLLPMALSLLVTQSVSADSYTYLDGNYLNYNSELIDSAYSINGGLALTDTIFLKARYRVLEFNDFVGLDEFGDVVAYGRDAKFQQTSIGAGVHGMVGQNTDVSVAVLGVKEERSGLYGFDYTRSGNKDNDTHAVELGVRHQFTEQVEGYLGLSKVYDSVWSDDVEYDVGGRFGLNGGVSVGLGYTGEFGDSESGAAYSAIRLGTL